MNVQPLPRVNLSMLVSIIVVVVIVLIFGIYWLINNSKAPGSGSNNNSNGQVGNNDIQQPNPEEFRIARSGDLVANISQLKNDNKVFSGKAEYDKDSGVWKLEMENQGININMVYKDNDVYMQNMTGSWVKATASENSTQVNLKQYELNDEWQKVWEEKAEFKGTEACPDGSGLCNVYAFKEDDVASVLHVHSTTYKVVRYTNAKDMDITIVDYDTDADLSLDIPKV